MSASPTPDVLRDLRMIRVNNTLPGQPGARKLREKHKRDRQNKRKARKR